MRRVEVDKWMCEDNHIIYTFIGFFILIFSLMALEVIM